MGAVIDLQRLHYHPVSRFWAFFAGRFPGARVALALPGNAQLVITSFGDALLGKVTSGSFDVLTDCLEELRCANAGEGVSHDLDCWVGDGGDGTVEDEDRDDDDDRGQR